jgi:type II secretory pathway predicted ATPase ExeA
MYQSFYHLRRSPFGISPEPDFFYPTPCHNEALAALYHAVREHKGFAVLTGEVGTGKTLLVRCLMELLSKNEDVFYAYVFNGLLSPSEFLQYIVADFGLPTAGKNKSQLLVDLSKYVVFRGTKGLTTVLIVDEAHHLSVEILEEIRLLTNLETSQDKLLQVLLVGQSELDNKLDSFNLRQLKQRIAHRARLKPLTLEETRGYMARRLEIAGADSCEHSLFPPETVATIYRYAHGIPRLINTLSDNALISAYARQMHFVTPEIVDSIAADFGLNVTTACPAAEPAHDSETEVAQAAKKLLELLAALQRKPANKEQSL